RSLTGSDLVEYMEPIVTDPSAVVPSTALDRIASEIGTYDEYHLVYGLELGPDHAPDLFAPAVPEFLSHESQTVRCAAFRALNRLPDRLITKPLLDAGRTALSSCPENESESWAGYLEDLDKRRRA